MPDPRTLGNAAKAVVQNDYEQDQKDIHDALRAAELAATYGDAELTKLLTTIALRNANLVVASGHVLSDDLKRAQDMVMEMKRAEYEDAKNARNSA